MNRWWIAGAAAIAVFAVVLLVGGWAARRVLRSFFYPPPPPMPPVVEISTDELLAELESVLQEKAPHIAAALQPGLSDGQIAALEAEGGFRLTEELRALYRWHNGMNPEAALDFIPGHGFPPLEASVRQRREVHEQLRSESWAQRAVYSVVAGHRERWVTVFDDLAGDGYFYDPDRRHSGGAFFYHVAETAHYRYFPSLRNFLAGIVECYETGAYWAADGKGVEEDFERSERTWGQYGVSNLTD